MKWTVLTREKYRNEYNAYADILRKCIDKGRKEVCTEFTRHKTGTNMDNTEESTAEKKTRQLQSSQKWIINWNVLKRRN